MACHFTISQKDQFNKYSIVFHVRKLYGETGVKYSGVKFDPCLESRAASAKLRLGKPRSRAMWVCVSVWKTINEWLKLNIHLLRSLLPRNSGCFLVNMDTILILFFNVFNFIMKFSSLKYSWSLKAGIK